MCFIERALANYFHNLKICLKLFSFADLTNASTMQTTRESSKQRRTTKRRHSRKKSLSPSDLKCTRNEGKVESKFNAKRSLSEGSMKVKHRKSNIRRTLTHPFTHSDGDFSVVESIIKSEVSASAPPESDESNLPPTSSDRDTEDDARSVRPVVHRPRWDSGSEMDSLVSIAVGRVSARRRRTPSTKGEYFLLVFNYDLCR